VSFCYKLSPFQAHWEKWNCTRVVRPACLFTVHVGVGSSPFSCAVFLPPPLSQAFLLLITGQCCCSCQLPCLFTVHVGSRSSLVSCGVFLPPPLSQAFLLLVVGHAPPLPPEALQPGQLVYLQSCEGFPSPNLWRSVCPTLFPACLYCFYCLLLSFSFFPQVEVGLSRGLCCSGPGLSVGVPCTPKLTWSMSSQAIWAPMTGGPGPSWFLHLMWSGDSLHWLEVWRGQSYASSQWLCLQSVSPASLQDFTVGGSLSASSL
jgi:hypothetical protein